jgi:hypothetical protein
MLNPSEFPTRTLRRTPTRYPHFLKETPADVEALDGMIRLKLMDGGTLEIPREEALELVPYRGVFVSPMLKSPLEGLLIHRGIPVPVLGPLPPSDLESLPYDERPWLLLLKGCAQTIRGLPEFDDAASTDAASITGSGSDVGGILGEIDELLKAA